MLKWPSINSEIEKLSCLNIGTFLKNYFKYYFFLQFVYLGLNMNDPKDVLNNVLTQQINVFLFDFYYSYFQLLEQFFSLREYLLNIYFFIIQSLNK